MSSETVIYEVNNQIATLTLNRPEKMNAFRLEEFDLLLGGIELAENDSDVKVIKIRSMGSRAFTGGLDLGMIQELTGSPEKIPDLLNMGENVVRTFYKTRKPIVVEVQGPAVAWGTILCLIADFVIAGENPKTFFTLNEIDIGIFPGTGALSTTLLTMGLKKAKKMLMIPEKLYLDQAEKVDLVTERVPLDQLEQKTEEFCQKLAKKAQNILLPVKGLLNYLHLNQIEKFFEKERDGFQLYMNNDLNEIQTYFEHLWQKLKD
jgi:enoyl-CoA hydratase/carnithine racemase